MKKILLLFLLMSISVFSQKQNEIEKLLNKELNKELKFRNDAPFTEQDTLIVTEPFTIKDNILSLTVKKRTYYETEFYLEKQEVDLSKIISIVKDINVLFETENDAVKITQTYKDGRVSRRDYDLFFLQISSEKKNKNLGKNAIKVFKKAGFSIELGNWYD